MRRPLWRVDLMPSAAPGHGDSKWARPKTLAEDVWKQLLSPDACQQDARQVFLGIGATFEVKATMRLKVAKLDVLPVVSSRDGWLRQCWRWAIHGSFCCIGLSRTWFLLRFLAFCVTVTIAWCVRKFTFFLGIYWRTHQQLQIRIFQKQSHATTLRCTFTVWPDYSGQVHCTGCFAQSLWPCDVAFCEKRLFVLPFKFPSIDAISHGNGTWHEHVFCYALRTFKNSRAGAAGVLIQIWPVSCDLLSLSPQSSSSARRDKL